ncbi:hypothetical protein Vafri_12141 [Volvox africanus]|uniref:Uncharacterized protein n=1 Tax=Volvox africanus TaxID=51714 RepID=A0A8J4BAD9_9CHLO|nr:hypothetical protein Vafri_12141 [Volvox africanus]
MVMSGPRLEFLGVETIAPSNKSSSRGCVNVHGAQAPLPRPHEILSPLGSPLPIGTLHLSPSAFRPWVLLCPGHNLLPSPSPPPRSLLSTSYHLSSMISEDMRIKKTYPQSQVGSNLPHMKKLPAITRWTSLTHPAGNQPATTGSPLSVLWAEMLVIVVKYAADAAAHHLVRQTGIHESNVTTSVNCAIVDFGGFWSHHQYCSIIRCSNNSITRSSSAPTRPAGCPPAPGDGL